MLTKHTAALSVKTIEEELCSNCCESLADSNFSSTFDADACKVQGCEEFVNETSEENLECSALNASLNDEERVGCEIGRDFRFLGVTALPLEQSDSGFKCSNSGEAEEFDLPTGSSNQNGFFINLSEKCSSCCTNLLEEFSDTVGDLLDEAPCKVPVSRFFIYFAESMFRKHAWTDLTASIASTTKQGSGVLLPLTFCKSAKLE